jgi:hypothetical protein
MESLRDCKKLSISCPICHTKKLIELPSSIVDKSKELTTISIPKDKVCNHHFQFFLDKNFIIRGYQKVDYELKDQHSNNKKLRNPTKMTLKEIYDEFWEYISDDNIEFRDFICDDIKRKRNFSDDVVDKPNEIELLPHVCKNSE